MKNTHLLCSHVRDSLIWKSPGDPEPESMVLAGRKVSLRCRAPCSQHGSRFAHSRTLWMATGQRSQPVPPSIVVRLESAFCVPSWGLSPLKCPGRAKRCSRARPRPQACFNPFFGTTGHGAPKLSSRANRHARRAARCGLLGGDWEHNQMGADFLRRPFSSKWVPLSVFLGFCAWISP